MIDDEDSVRKLGASVLEEFGYSVLSASNGREGLEIFLNESHRIDLVILDLIMPEMSGRECLQEMVRLHPETKVIIASGYAANGQMDQACEEGATASIEKPYETRRLLN